MNRLNTLNKKNKARAKMALFNERGKKLKKKFEVAQALELRFIRRTYLKHV